MVMDDPHATQVNALVVDMLTPYVDNPIADAGFFAMDEEQEAAAAVAVETQIWLQGGAAAAAAEDEDMNIVTTDAVNFNDSASLFYNEEFPLLPDFPCMSSSSSSSSAPAPVPSKPPVSSSASSASSSSSVTSWSVLRSDGEDASAPSDCMDVMENFGYMDLVDVSDLWDPSSIFNGEDEKNSQVFEEENRKKEEEEEERQLDELGAMFFEWLKTNKEHISAQDMRSIKLKRSTVESASKRLGSTKEGKKQLLKLILEWVEQYQLQKKKNGETMITQFPTHCFSQSPNPNLNSNSAPNTCSFPPPPPSWIPQPPPYDPTAGFYIGDSYSDVTNFNPALGCHNYPPPPPAAAPPLPPVSADYQMMESGPPVSWPPSQFMMTSQYNQFPGNINTNIVPDSTMNLNPVGFYGDQYPYHHQQQQQQVFGENNNGERLRLGSLATKEARKKRMARQRRVNPSHHHGRHHHNSNHQSNHENQNHQAADRSLRLSSEQCGTNGQSNNPGTWVYLPCGSAPPPPPGVSAVRMMPPTMAAGGGAVPPAVAPKRTGVQNYHRQAAADRRQGWKQEKNLKFLLQKVLKQSDVGNLGRIVLPKKEAETHLPALDTRDGIAISMEDIGSSRVWNMRYRFWPNNKSRMYLLENTGEFVRANGLQEGDFIVIYSDIKCGKYLIRGVKVRQTGAKAEGKKTARRNQRISSSHNGPSSSSLANQN